MATCIVCGSAESGPGHALGGRLLPGGQLVQVHLGGSCSQTFAAVIAPYQRYLAVRRYVHAAGAVAGVYLRHAHRRYVARPQPRHLQPRLPGALS